MCLLRFSIDFRRLYLHDFKQDNRYFKRQLKYSLRLLFKQPKDNSKGSSKTILGVVSAMQKVVLRQILVLSMQFKR